MLDLKVFTASVQIEKTWVQKLEEARREKHRETAEATCQADETEASSVTISVEELDSRLSAQKQELQLEADKVKRKAVEEARKQTQRELHEKHLEDMAKQVSVCLFLIILVLVSKVRVAPIGIIPRPLDLLRLCYIFFLLSFFTQFPR